MDPCQGTMMARTGASCKGRRGKVPQPVLIPWPDTGYTTKMARNEALNLAHELYPEIPIPALSSVVMRTRRWIGDTGTSRHIGSINILTGEERRGIRKADKPITLATAAGLITIDEEVDVKIPQLHGITTMKLLEDSPAALSIGYLCEEDDYSFYWQNRSGKAVLIHNNGVDRIDWDIENYVPSFYEDLSNGTALPSKFQKGKPKPKTPTRNKFGPLSEDDSERVEANAKAPKRGPVAPDERGEQKETV